VLPIANEVSTTAVISGFSYPVKTPLPEDKLQDWELAGVALNDASQGLLVKVWHCTLEIDPDTTVGSVYVEAPGVAKTLLFSGAGITEVALAFDQNMNPFVAYMQGSDAKIFWYDPLAPGMVHTTLPAGCYDLRCCMDEKRPFNIGNSDIVLAYIRASNLCIRYQRDRYLVEYVLKAGVGSTAKLVSMALNQGFRLQWRLRNYALNDDPNALIQVEPYLGDVVEDLCIRANIKRENINVSELYRDLVPGMKVDVDEGLDKPIGWLRDVFFFDKSEHDRTLGWPKRGRNVMARIPYSDLVRGEPIALKQKIVDETKLAREVILNHLDPDGGFAKNHQTAQRRSNLVKAQGKKKIDTKVVLTADQAATAAMTKLKIDWHEQITYTFSTTIKWTEITDADVIEVEDSKGIWHRVRIEERNEDSGVIDWTAKQDGGFYTYNGIATGHPLRPPVSTTPGVIGETRFEILNIPVQRDQDDELGLYLAGAGENTAWTGYQLLVSTDGGTSYAEAFTTDIPATLGDTETDLPAITSYQYQGNQTVDVLVNFPLASINDDQIMGNQNRCVIGDEVLQFKTATLLGMDGARYLYRLSGLVRGRYATPPEFWPLGTRFVLLDSAVIFAQAQRAMLGLDLHYKPVSVGTTEDETIPTAYLYDEGVNQTEWPVDNVASSRDGSNNVTVTWIGRARLGLDTAPFHSKYFRGYRVKFSDGHTIDTTDQTATYSSAPVGATVQVCGLNEITGEGPYSTALAT
jgi:hypothetical protein